MTNTPDKQSPVPAGKQVLGPDDVRRAITRMAHEIIERNRGLAGVALVGIQTGGVWVAEMLAAEIARIEPDTDGVRLGSVDASLYRDDIGLRPVTPGTGRTVRSALDAIGDYGRPKSVQLAVIVDRGHRELPIRPDYVGKNLPTSSEESVSVTAAGVVISGGGS